MREIKTADECLANLRGIHGGEVLADSLEPLVRAFVCPTCGAKDPALGMGLRETSEGMRAFVFCRACALAKEV